MTFKLKSYGFDKAFNDLDKIAKKKIEEGTQNGLERCSNLALATLRATTPVDTGVLRQTEKITITGKRGRFIGTDPDQAPYAYWVEYGHHTRSGGFLPGQFFAERALIQVLPQLARIMGEEINKSVHSS